MNLGSRLINSNSVSMVTVDTTDPKKEQYFPRVFIHIIGKLSTKIIRDICANTDTNISCCHSLCNTEQHYGIPRNIVSMLVHFWFWGKISLKIWVFFSQKLYSSSTSLGISSDMINGGSRDTSLFNKVCKKIHVDSSSQLKACSGVDGYSSAWLDVRYIHFLF